MDTAWTDGVLRFGYTTRDELAEISAMLTKPSVCAHVSFGPSSDAETRGYFLPLLEPMWASLERAECPRQHVFTIRMREDPAFVGDCGLLPVAFGAGNYTVGFLLDEPYWRRGYGTRTCEFLVWYALSQLGARRLSGEALRSNVGSLRVLERCGFRFEGARVGYFERDGQPRDELLFGLFADECDVESLSPRFRAVD